MAGSLKCPNCGYDVWWNAIRCQVCYQHIGFPNTLKATSVVEKEALDDRYRVALSEASDGDTFVQVNDFEKAILEEGQAVINLGKQFLLEWLLNQLTYEPYRLRIAVGLHEPLPEKADTERRLAEVILFPTSDNPLPMVYGALSLDKRGPLSYGECSACIADIAISERASVLDEDSLKLVRKYGFLVPPGHRAAWTDRGKLAVTKFGGSITRSTSKADFAEMVVQSDGDWENEIYLEVNIYGGIHSNAVQAVRIPNVTPEHEEYYKNCLQKIEDLAELQEKACIRYDL